MNLKKIFLLSASSIALCACNQDDERVYSCDKTINKWVSNHLAEIHQMDRNDWLKTNQSISRAVYSAFTPNQKLSFWKEKFIELKNIAWSEEELAHIKKVESFVLTNKDLFEDTKLTDDQLDVLDSFFYKWVKEAENNLGWDKAMCIAIAGSGNTVINRKGELRALPTNSGGNVMSASTEAGCNCNTSVLSDFCGVAGPGGCEDTNCDGSDFGCGWIWVQDCNGTCPL
ncbi:bacteriocin fulvocin C-related protein [uncultured Prevotella sp.]|uniref:bacteriocin fulvocin C-related protein n=1 Tax=uncultured Prevotella sp. TaxID=159272 RepID=UPI0026208700|nr:bacteriocin fulvocin C-related protein [uncultured Prevotella sp.]